MASSIDCAWFGQVLHIPSSFLLDLPPHLKAGLTEGTNKQFLQILAELALEPQYTDHIFARCESLVVELCSRWMSNLDSVDPVRVVATLARWLTLRPDLTIYAEDIACRRRLGSFGLLFAADATALLGLDEDACVALLVTLLRLVECDPNTFECLVQLPKMQVLLLSKGVPCVKILAAKLICYRLGLAETSFDQLTQKYLGDDASTGLLDGRTINFRFWSLWEEQRFQEFEELVTQARGERTPVADPTAFTSPSLRELGQDDLLSQTANFAGELFPRLDSTTFQESSMVMSPATVLNMRDVAGALRDSRPVLVTGPSGCGKTALVNDIARRLGKLSDMLVLHLNDQTDAKLLVGLYTSGAEPGTFEWQPGVLTTAIKEGRWVFIEDLDRAPSEIISLLLPLLERNELLVPNLGGWITANKSFKIIASSRSTVNSRGEEVTVNERMLGFRHWKRTHLRNHSEQDLRQIIYTRYPRISRFEKEIMGAYSNILKDSSVRPIAKEAFQRKIGVGELLRFCSRLSAQLAANGFTEEGLIPENFYDIMLLDALDCFTGSFESTEAREHTAAIISQELHASPERMRFCLSSRIPKYSSDSSEDMLSLGRVSLSRRKTSSRKIRRTRFAGTPQALRRLESLAVAVKMSEPCLLVGETGVGKTAVVQELAASLGIPLTVVNLSQQSEVNDLLGGFKPLNIRAMILPIKDDFDNLFAATFSSTKNTAFLQSLDAAIRSEKWQKVLAHFNEALRLVQSWFKKHEQTGQESARKRRRLESPNHLQLKKNWQSLIGKLRLAEKHLSSDEGGVIFSFVEGNLVKAVRNGTWVLLDEINLASPDTLECIADLLSHGGHEEPFLLLSETGNIQKIAAHPEFRLFGAMNPATDIGKRDLPPSIRSRFTEFYVHSADSCPESLLQIVSLYLEDYVSTDRVIAEAITKLFLSIRELENANRLVDGAGQKPHFTLRSLCRALTFASDIGSQYGLRRALVEGFSMCFLTVLNAESKSLVYNLIHSSLLANVRNTSGLLKRLPKRPDNGKSYVEFQQYWLPQGDAQASNPGHYIITPYVEENLLNLVRTSLSRRYPVLLQGPTSSGKTSMIEYLAARSGNKFVRINNHEHTDLQEYLGTYISTPNGLIYQDGVLVQALRYGHWIVLDELNLAPTDVLEALNRLLDDNRELLVPETQEVVRPHPNFMLFATQNPPGMYGGRKLLSRAFRNRFVELHFDDIPENELETILKERCPQIAPSFCTKIVLVYKKLAILRQSERLFEQRNSFATLRDLFRWAQRNATDRKQLAVDGFMLLGERVRNDKERQIVQQVIEDVLKEQIDLDDLYAPSVLGLGMIGHRKDIVWTRSALRLAILIQSALDHNEPVLLIGETGCGKTSICQELAARKGVTLNIMNAHQNMETGDLIGAQRPLRNRDALETRLIDTLENLFRDQQISVENQGSRSLSLLKAFDGLSESQRESELERCKEIYTLRSMTKVLFEWADGSLVKAMKEGEYYLLDEISLADDSVLERLNSVLEPARTILLAEKGSSDTLVSAASGFQFLATMNPGGDYGKKELSPALRNRFTEIWVPALSPEDDITPILEVKLAGANRFRIPAMISFARWFADTFNISKNNISIRDLLAWTDLINASTSEDLDLAFVHGAAMVFIDSLGAAPSAGQLVTQDSLKQQRQICMTKLKHLTSCDTDGLYNSVASIVSTNDRLSIGDFSVARQSHVSVSRPFSFEATTTRSNASRILRALQLSKPVLLEGNPGVGKTTIITTLAETLGVPLTRINLSDQTDLMDLFGSDVPLEDGEVGHFGWRDAPFLRAMQNGDWVLLDEMNLASQSVLEGLNACLDHRGTVFVPELGRAFTKHPKFTLFAAQNPHHQGGGRKGLPASFVNRFTVVYADVLTNEDLMTICKEIFPAVESSTAIKAVQYVSRLEQLAISPIASFEGGPWEFNLRDLLRWFTLSEKSSGFAGKASLSDYEHLLFRDRIRNHRDLEKVESLRESLGLSESPQHTHYRNYGKTWYQCGFGLMKRAPLSSNCRHPQARVPAGLVESAMICVQQSWPLLLVGASGSGKSALVYHLASSVGAEVSVLPLSADSDAFDLVGGYEQADWQRKTTSFIFRLKQKVRILISSIVVDLISSIIIDGNDSTYASRLVRLWSVIHEHENLDKETLAIVNRSIQELDTVTELSQLRHECSSLVYESSCDNRARFEWVDGVLTQALEEGFWLVLDNANACSSSVLDRLNALLEPTGSLSIHEHRRLDGSPRTVHPHPNFRIFLTMDPRYGELSRAMRNRCVELYLPDPTQSRLPQCLAPTADLFRYRSFTILGSVDMNSVEAYELSRVCFGNLAYSDLPSLIEWYNELERGLCRMKHPIWEIFDPMFEVFSNTGKSSVTFLKQFKEVLLVFTNDVDLYSDQLEQFTKNQPLNVLFNGTLLYKSGMDSDIRYFEWLSQAFDTTVDLLFVLSLLRRRATASSSSSKNRSITLINSQRSLASFTNIEHANEPTQPVSKFLFDFATFFTDWITKSLHQRISKQECQILEDTCDIVQDIFRVINRTDFDHAAFYIYLAKAKSLASSASQLSSISIVGVYLVEQLQAFEGEWQLKTGGSMFLLWQNLRPEVASNIFQLQNQEVCKALANRFDEISWVMHTSLNHVTEIRDLFSTTYQDLRIGNPHMALQNIQKILDEEEQQIHPFNQPTYPYFAKIFEGIRQRKLLGSPCRESRESRLAVFAGRKTKELLYLPPRSVAEDVLSSLASCTGIDTEDSRLLGLDRYLLGNTLRQILDASQVSLAGFGMLREEYQMLGKQLTEKPEIQNQNSLALLNSLLAKLHMEIYLVHRDFGQITFTENYAQAVQNLMVSYSECLHRHGSVIDALQFCDAKHFQTIAETYFVPSIENLVLVTTQQPNSYALSSYAWTSFFLGLIFLFVPDKPCDPSLEAIINRERWSRKHERYAAKLGALQTHQNFLTGESKSLCISIAKDKLVEHTEAPPAPAIVRPSVSKLANLQGELSNIIRFISAQASQFVSPARRFQSKQGAYPYEAAQEFIRSLSNALRRLEVGFEEYQDIVQPVMYMLYGLSIGCELGMTTGTADENNKTPPVDDPSFSLLGIRIASDDLSVNLEHCGGKSNSFQSQALTLQLLDLQRTAANQYTCLDIRSMQDCFATMFSSWQGRLRTEQAKNAAKSALYRYAGSIDDGEADEEKELEDLFPECAREKVPRGYQNIDPRQRAIAAAELQSQLTTPSSGGSQSLLRVYEEYTTLNALREEKLVCSSQSRGILSAVLLAINKHYGELDATVSKRPSYNFYRDQNTIEVKNLNSLLWRIWERFATLKAAWPEHATIDAVLQSVKLILDVPYSEPMAFYLPKVEKLHLFIHEWQTVASREYSAVAVYDDLTKLLVNWRRVELSTWASILDFEEHKCVEDAKSWWFVAYELIVHSALSTEGHDEAFHSHVGSMVAELQKFLSSTSFGLFSHRLDLLDHFGKYTGTLSKVYPYMQATSEAVSNVVNYFSRFKIVIDSHNKAGRCALEKEMKEIVLLASWKDTNIQALRESSQKSHRKILKLIKKYRAVLAKSVEISTREEAPFDRPELPSPHHTATILDQSQNAKELCAEILEEWAELHTRFKNVKATCAKIRDLSQPPSFPDSEAYLLAFGRKVAEAAGSLRKETPEMLTEDNKDFVKHLKSRKRRLFVDVLKEIRSLGFQSNIDLETLRRQASSSVVLSVCRTNSIISNTDSFLFGILDHMDSIRASVKDHSVDISGSETARGSGFLEGMLKVIIQQRKSIVHLSNSLQRFDLAFEKIQAIQVQDNGKIAEVNRPESLSLTKYKSKLAWLQWTVEASHVILRNFEALGGQASISTHECFGEWTKRLKQLQHSLESIPNLPAGLSSSVHSELIERIHSDLQRFKDNLISHGKESPHVGFLVAGLFPWVDENNQLYGFGTQFEVDQAPPDGVQGSKLVMQLKSLVDSILVQVQNVSSLQSEFVCSVEEPSWYTKNELLNFEIGNVVKIDDTVAKLEKFSDCIQFCEGSQLRSILAFCSMQTPVLAEYQSMIKGFIERSFKGHVGLCEATYTFSGLFRQIVAQGFCTPEENSVDKAGPEKLEDGTGLGEGQGAEDISKDVEADEDLSELAQQERDRDSKTELENEEDAVDMADQELEGDTGEQGNDNEDEAGDNEDDQAQSPEDEVGNVDKEEDDVVDEKFWDGEEDSNQDTKESADPKGKKKEDLTAQANEAPETRDEDSDESEIQGAEESDMVAPEGEEELDPYTKDGENLDLPDDMDVENGADDDLKSDMDLSDADQLSDDMNYDENSDGASVNDEHEHSEQDLPDQEVDIPDVEEKIASNIDPNDNSDQTSEVEPDEKAETQGLQGEPDNSITTVEDTSFEKVANENTGLDTHDVEQENRALGAQGEQKNDLGDDPEVADAEVSQGSGKAKSNETQSKEPTSDDAPDADINDQPFKKLGDALEKWHRYNKQIENASEREQEPRPDQDEANPNTRDFEHLPDDGAKPDAQVLAPAPDDQSYALEKDALDFEETMEHESPTADLQETTSIEDEEMVDVFEPVAKDANQSSRDPVTSSMEKERRQRDRSPGQSSEEADADLDDIDAELSVVQLESNSNVSMRSLDEARSMWADCERLTQDLALSLTEQLRLILAPTQAAKMRGDFRTGKRLNIKRIIPYIASQYKRDKIWMRRTVPSKRTYQVLLAVDDSKSMSQGGAGRVALESLTLLSRSLALLEVGQLCVVSFGTDVRVAHAFDQPFAAADAGPRAFQHFSFEQPRTDVHRLVARSLELFQTARAAAPSTSGAAHRELWQLQLVISDGICDNHDAIRRLVRQAQEERVMIVFVIVDAAAGNPSILDMQEASFDVDPSTGDMRPRMTRYLDRFPFGYYLIVSEVRDLPGVLAMALRQWFAEVAGYG